MTNHPYPFRIKIEAYQQEELLVSLKKYYSDFHLGFDKYIPPLLRTLCELCYREGISAVLAKDVLKKCKVNKKDFKDDPESLDFIRAILLSILVLMYQGSPAACVNSVRLDCDGLLRAYPQYRNLPVEEIDLLLNFRNRLAVALLLIPAYRNKGILIKVAGRLEGSDRVYVLGTGQTEDVDRREFIYNQEGNVTKNDETGSLNSGSSSAKRSRDASFTSPHPEKKKASKKAQTYSSSSLTTASSSSSLDSDYSPIQGRWNIKEEGKVDGHIVTKNATDWNPSFTEELQPMFP